MIGAFLSIIVVHAARPARHHLGAARAAAGAAGRDGRSPRLYGWTVERLAYRPLRGSFRLAPLISAIGMSIFLQNYVQLTQGARVKPLPPVISGGFTCSTTAAASRCTISYVQIIIILLDGGADGRVLLPDRPHRARPRPARLRAGPADGGAARRQRRPHDLADLRDGRGARRGRRADGDALLRRDRLLHRLPRRGQGVHRGGARRHRLAARARCWAASRSA